MNYLRFLFPTLVHSGGLRLKRDITEYGEFVRSFNAPSIEENFELLGMYVIPPNHLLFVGIV